MIIEGAIAVKSALQNNKREVKTVYICKDKKTYNSLVKKIKKAGARNVKFKFKKG